LVVDKVGEGIGAVFHPSPDNDLPGLREGSEVTVQYLNVPGAQIDPNRQTVGGMVTRINGDRDRIIVRLSTGRTETLKLTHHAQADGTGVVMTYTGAQTHQPMRYYFKRRS
jgi:hypothetical protein